MKFAPMPAIKSFDGEDKNICCPKLREALCAVERFDRRGDACIVMHDGWRPAKPQPLQAAFIEAQAAQ
jgi:hypothetical protein